MRNRREIFPRQQRDLLRLAAPAPILHPDLFALLPAAMHVPPVSPVTPEKPPLLVLRQFVAGELEGRERTLCIPRRAKLPASKSRGNKLRDSSVRAQPLVNLASAAILRQC